MMILAFKHFNINSFVSLIPFFGIFRQPPNFSVVCGSSTFEPSVFSRCANSTGTPAKWKKVFYGFEYKTQDLNM